MARKVARALLILAVLLIGLKPVADLAVASAASLAQPCCTDCDQPAMPDGTDCGKASGCAAAPSFTPALASSDVTFTAALSQPLLTEAGPASADTAPPFRPPRS